MEMIGRLLACCTSRTPGTGGADAGEPAGSSYPDCSLEACGCTQAYESPYPARSAYTVREARLWVDAPGGKSGGGCGAGGGALREAPIERASALGRFQGGLGEGDSRDWLEDAQTRGYDFCSLRSAGSLSHRGSTPGSGEGSGQGGRGGFLQSEGGSRRTGLFDPLGLPAKNSSNVSRSPLSDASTQGAVREKSPTPSLLSDETLSTRSHNTSVCSIASTDQWTEEGLAHSERPRYAEAHSRLHKKKTVYA